MRRRRGKSNAEGRSGGERPVGRLRPQPERPRTRRMYSTPAVPSTPAALPVSARKRRQRGAVEGFTSAGSTVWRIVSSPRWVSLAVLGLCVYALVLLGTNDRFFITQVPVAGALAHTPEEVAAASELAGQHVFAADLAAAADAVAALPGVSSASVSLTWPDRVQIAVVEAVPVLLWEERDTLYWVTRDGAFLPAGEKAFDLLLIKAEVPATIDGPYLDYVPEDVMAGIRALTVIRPDATELYYSPSGGLSIDDGDWRVYYGTGDEMAVKEQVYQALIDWLNDVGIRPTEISVANPAKPHYYAPELLPAVEPAAEDGG